MPNDRNGRRARKREMCDFLFFCSWPSWFHKLHTQAHYVEAFPCKHLQGHHKLLLPPTSVYLPDWEGEQKYRLLQCTVLNVATSRPRDACAQIANTQARHIHNSYQPASYGMPVQSPNASFRSDKLLPHSGRASLQGFPTSCDRPPRNGIDR